MAVTDILIRAVEEIEYCQRDYPDTGVGEAVARRLEALKEEMLSCAREFKGVPTPQQIADFEARKAARAAEWAAMSDEEKKAAYTPAAERETAKLNRRADIYQGA